MSESRAPGSRTLVAVLPHADDESIIAPMLAALTRDGVTVYLIVVSDGSAGAGQQGNLPRPELALTVGELITTRQAEARCAAQILGAEPPIFLGFPDGKLGDYVGDRTLIFRLTQRIAEELERLAPDVVITWGPDGGTGHPDHRIVSSVVTQLQRTGASGVPERLFYMSVPLELMRAVSPQGNAPAFVMPEARYFTTTVPFTADDFATARRAWLCHRTQFTPDVVERFALTTEPVWDGSIRLVAAFSAGAGEGLFG